MNPDRYLLFPPFRFDSVTAELWCGPTKVALMPKDLAMLHYLVSRPAMLVTKEELLQAIWPDTKVDQGILKVIFRRLRRALGDSPTNPRFIETIYKRGYRWIAPLFSEDSQPPTELSRQQQSLVVSPRHSMSGLIGRAMELERLQHLLRQASQGDRRIVFLSGETGVGKTALVEEFLSQTIPTSDVFVIHSQCIERYGIHDPYLPVFDALNRCCRSIRGEQTIALLRRVAPAWLVQMPWLLSEMEQEVLRRKVPSVTPGRMLRELAEALEALARKAVVVVILEDLHWSDPATLDMVSYLARRQEPARLLLIGTYRTAAALDPDQPLSAMIQDLQLHQHCTELCIPSLNEAQVHDYVMARFVTAERDKKAPRALAHVIHQRTDGNPLFMVNLVDYLLARTSSDIHENDAELKTVLQEIPAGIRQMIERQIDRLSTAERRILTAASVIGTEFSAAAIVTLINSNAGRVEECCEALARRQMFLAAATTPQTAERRLTARYRFRHALYREVLYRRLTPVRRQEFQQRMGEWKEFSYGERVKDIAAELAEHFEQGHDYRRAAYYYEQAANNALQRSAQTEANDFLARGQTLQQYFPDTSLRKSKNYPFRSFPVRPRLSGQVASFLLFLFLFSFSNL